MSPILVQKNYRDIQREYDLLFTRNIIRDEGRAYRWHAECLLTHAPKAKAILDVACGGGFFLREINRAYPQAELVGIDISEQALKIARRECPASFRLLAIAKALPFQKKKFDVIVCLGSLEHFLNIEQSLAEMTTVLKDDGIFYILAPNMFWYKDILSVLWSGSAVARNQTQEKLTSLRGWRDVLEKAGLNILRAIKYNGISKNRVKQEIKKLVIPRMFSYHFLFLCEKKR